MVLADEEGEVAGLNRLSSEVLTEWMSSGSGVCG